jgi:hypothetical protein
MGGMGRKRKNTEILDKILFERILDKNSNLELTWF